MPASLTFLFPCYGGDEPLLETIKMIPFDKIKDKFEISILIVATPDNNLRVPKLEPIIDIWKQTKLIIEDRRGYGRAYKTGFLNLNTDFVLTADSDCTYSLDIIDELISNLDINNIDFVNFSRMDKAHKNAFSKRNKFGNRILTQICNMMYKIKIRDSQTGMWLIRTNKINREQIELYGDGMEFSSQIKITAYLNDETRFVEIESPYYERVGPEPQLNWLRDGIRILIQFVRFKRIYKKFN